MKTKNKLIFAISLLAASCIGFLIGISVDFPKPDPSELAGTIGKAEKYRKVQMTAKDIQLRSEFLKDTTQLRSMIQGLVYFSLFTEEVSTNIELTIMAFQAQGMGTQTGETDKISALRDYSDFIRNNNKTLNATIALLTGFYLKDSVDLSQDVEKTLRDFGAYLNNLNEKNSALNQALSGMDNFMLNNKTLQDNKEQIARLKSIRDQLLMKGIQLGGILSNKEQVDDLISYAYSAQEKLGLVLGNEKLSYALASEKLQLLLSPGGIQSALYSTQTVNFIASQDLGVVALLYDKPGLQFITTDKAPLNQAVAGSSNLQAVAFTGAGELYVVLSNYSLQNVVQSQVLSGSLAANTLNRIFSMDNLQGILYSTGGMNGMLTLLANQNLGVIAPPPD